MEAWEPRHETIFGFALTTPRGSNGGAI